MDSPGKNTGVGSHSLLQGIFPTQGSKPGLPYFRQTIYRLSHQGSLCKTYIHKYIHTHTHTRVHTVRGFILKSNRMGESFPVEMEEPLDTT